MYKTFQEIRPRLGDVVKTKGVLLICQSSASLWKVSHFKKQHRDARYFRCTLGTVANPYRPEHFVPIPKG